MMLSRRHPLLDGLLMATLVVTSFGGFVFALAQTATVTSQCLEAGITDYAACDAYMRSLTTANTTSTTTSGTTSGTTSTNTSGTTSGSTTTTDSGGTGTTATNTTDTATTAATSCNDSDGRDPLLKGYVSLPAALIYDRCLDQYTVAEQICGSSGAYAEPIRCVSGSICDDGRCIPAPVSGTTATTTSGTSSTSTTTSGATATTGTSTANTTTLTCTDTDGGDAPAVFGTLTYGNEGFPDTCRDRYTVEEQFCSSTGRVSAGRTCPSTAECRDGRCVPRTYVCGDAKCESALGESATVCAVDCAPVTTATTATGTASGTTATTTSTEPVTATTTTNTAGSTSGTTDSTSGSTATSAMTTTTTATVPAPICGDTDGGRAYGVRGVVSVGGTGYPDRCIDSGTLEEQYCDAGARRVDVRRCGDGFRCAEGRCVTATTATAPGTTTTSIAPAATSVSTDTTATATSGTTSGTTGVTATSATGSTTATVTATTAAPATTVTATAQPADETTATLPAACLVAGRDTATTCQQFLLEQALPEECRRAGITDLAVCKIRLAALAAPSVDERCRRAGILADGGCQQYLFGLAQAAAVAADDAATTTVATVAALPARCRESGVTDPAACAKYLAFADLPMSCLRQGIESKERCEAWLQSSLVDPRCAAQGITDPEACKEAAFARVSQNVSCDGLQDDACRLTVKERHLGTVTQTEERIAAVERAVDGAIGSGSHLDQSTLLETDASASAAVAAVLPVVEPRRQFLVLRSEPGIVVSKDDRVDAAAGRILAFDADADGLPDDVELRLGLDPSRADTDGDGKPDKEEAIARRESLAGIDRAMAEGRSIGQPVTQGDIDPRLTVSLPAPAADASTGSAPAIVFTGTGEPGAVVTLYVYSELPVVLTTTVRDDGTWSYEFGDRLTDGTHEVYVAVNDDTGRVERKSNPLSFLVQGASAATVAQAAESAALTDISPFVAAQEAPAYDIRLFLIGGLALVLLASALVAALFRRPETVQ